jgi:hypothetical protein
VTDTATRYTDYVYAMLQKRINELDVRLSKVEQGDKIAETAYAVPVEEALAGAPTDLTRPELRWIENGRKPGEGAGLGTGVLAVWSPAPLNAWISCFSGTAVTV